MRLRKMSACACAVLMLAGWSLPSTAAGVGQASRPIVGKVPLVGPLAPVPPTAQTHVPKYRPDCRWRSERYHHPAKGWMTRRVPVCR